MRTNGFASTDSISFREEICNMKKLIALAFASICAVPAFSQVMSIEASPLDATFPAVDQMVYSGVPGPYSAFAAGNFAQNDDYQANLAGTPFFGNSQFQVKSMQFVGGVTAVGGILDFFFLDSTGTNVRSSFSVAFTFPKSILDVFIN